MSKKKPLNQNQEAAAKAKFATGDVKAPDAVQATLKASGVVKQHPEYPTRPGMQASVADWENAAHNLADIDQKLAAEHAAIAAIAASQGITIGSWKRSTATLVAIIDALCNGSEKAIKAWGFEVQTHTPGPVETAAPQSLRATFSRKDLSLTLRWKAVRGQRGYQIQIGDTSNPVVWGPVVPVPNARFQPLGLNPGQHISVRVAVVRKTGLSPWSDILVLVVR